MLRAIKFQITQHSGDHVVKRSLDSLLVGCIAFLMVVPIIVELLGSLNVVQLTQPDSFPTVLAFDTVLWPEVALIFIIPFALFSYFAYSYRGSYRAGRRALLLASIQAVLYLGWWFTSQTYWNVFDLVFGSLSPIVELDLVTVLSLFAGFGIRRLNLRQREKISSASAGIRVDQGTQI